MHGARQGRGAKAEAQASATPGERETRIAKWQRRLAQARWPLFVLFWASFAETIIVPIPIEVVLVPFMLARRDQIWLIATITAAGCLAAAVLGYGVGLYVFESAGRWLLETWGYGAAFQSFQSTFDELGFWAIIAIGVIPIPFQVAMLAAGTAGYPLLMFLLAATIARGIRYYGLAWLVLVFGGRALDLWRDRSKTIGVAAVVLFIALLLSLNYLPRLLT